MTTIEGIGIPDSKLCKEITEHAGLVDSRLNRVSRAKSSG